MKKFIYILIIAAGAALLIFFSDNIFSQFREHTIEMQLENDKAVVYKSEAQIVERYSAIEQDAVFAESYFKENIFDRDNGIPVGKADIESAGKMIFPQLFNSVNIYERIAFIDKDGREISVMDGDGFHMPDYPLDVSNSQYFDETSSHKSGEIYASFDGSTLYVCSPIYNKNNSFSGEIVLTLKKEVLIKELQDSANNDNIDLIEDTGKYILTYDKDAKQNFAEDYSNELFSEILSKGSGQIETKEGRLFTFDGIKLDDHKWFLIASSDREEMASFASSLRRNFIIILSVTVLAFIILSLSWFRSYKKTIIAEQMLKKNQELEGLNEELLSQQEQLEEQSALVEELNVQLEEEVEKFQHQKDTLQSISDSVGEGIVMIGIANEVVFINRAWRDIFAYHDEKDGSRIDVKDFISDMRGRFKRAEDSVRSIEDMLQDYEKTYSTEIEQVNPVHRYLSLYSVPCISQSGKFLGRIFVCHDITHEKEVDGLKSELISTVSHELRTPMSSIMGFSELLLTRELTPEKSKKYINIIHSESHRLTNLINDFLDIQRMESGKQVFNKQYVAFENTIKEAVKLFENADKNHRIIYEFSEKNIPAVYCDPDKIIQVISNLLSNAIKYSPKGGDVIVKVELEGHMLKVGVKDFGLGIPDEVKEKLFTKFFRVDNDDRREIGGTGLGLAICREIVLSHGGQIWVESVHGTGSTFYFTLPLIKENPKEASGDSKNVISPGKKAILIVEDDNNLSGLLEDVLKGDGFETHAVDTGEEALKLIDESNFSIIILDINLMGKLNGWDVVKTLKNNDRTANIPVIISSIFENKELPMAKNVEDFLVKPFESEQLLKTIHRVLKEGHDTKRDDSGRDIIDGYVTDALISKGINVKGCQRSGNILIITLEGGKRDEVQ